MLNESTHSVLNTIATETWFMRGDKVKSKISQLANDVRAAKVPDVAPNTKAELRADDGSDGRFYVDGYRVENGVATIPIIGTLTKYAWYWDSYYGFVSAEALEATIDKALGDYQVKSIVLLIDCPGGMVAGTTQVADYIARKNGTGDGQKPFNAIVSDLCASGGYFLAAQCSTIAANPAAQIGCIGVYCVLTDDSEYFEKLGVSFHLVTSGGVKGLGADGKVSAELIADRQRSVDAHYQIFLDAVASGRGITPDQAKSLGDGRVWIAAEAKQLGLIDSVESLDDTMSAITTEVASMDADQFKAYLAQHPDDPALASVKTAAAQSATTAERSRIEGIAAAFGLSDHAAFASIKAGDSVDVAKRIADASSKASSGKETELQQALKRIEQLEASAGTQGAVPTSKSTTTDTTTTPSGTAKARFDAAVEVGTKQGLSPAAAIAKVVKEQPQLHQEYVAEMNANRAKPAA